MRRQRLPSTTQYGCQSAGPPVLRQNPVRRAFVAGTVSLLAAPYAAGAQQSQGKVPRIGVLRPGSPPDPFIEAFRQGLRDLGYDEGRNISIEYRWTEGRDERLPDLAADLVRLKVAVIVTSGPATLAAKRVTTTIPIVMQISIDPVRRGLVASLARPGGNITGLANLNEDIPGKWLELLKEIRNRSGRCTRCWGCWARVA